MERFVYFDNSATTKPCDEAAAAAENAIRNCFANPSSLYDMGMSAENIISDSRLQIAQKLNCREDEIFFTSGGTESNNTALFGAAELLKRRGDHIVTTSVEHPSVLEPIKKLEKYGFNVTYIKPQKSGNITPQQFEDSIKPNTILVSCMAVNNETGAIFPVQKLKSIITKAGSPALLHSDCVQAFGKMNLSLYNMGADLISLSAHKIHSIKGAGAMYVKKGIHLPAFMLGGGQENGLRSGTEAVPAIAAFGAAVRALPDCNMQLKKIERLKNRLMDQLKTFSNVVINSPDNALPFLLNFSFLGYRSETLLHFLESKGVYVSSGSACSKGKGSRVLREMGLDRQTVDSALRISFSRFNYEEETDRLFEALKQVSQTLKRSVK